MSIVKFLNKLAFFIYRTPAKNTVAGDTLKQRIRENNCRNLGCIHYGRYYVFMEQSTCRRCGHKNSCAQDIIEEWNIPE